LNIEDTGISSLIFLIFLCAANITCPTIIVTVQPSMAAFFSLHGIVASDKQPIWNQHDLFTILAIPHNNARFSCNTANCDY
jgi:hypothetical protein